MKSASAVSCSSCSYCDAISVKGIPYPCSVFGTWRLVFGMITLRESSQTRITASCERLKPWPIRLPLVQPLSDYLASLPANDDANAFIFPGSAVHKHSASLSNQFREILVDAGLVEPRGHEATGKGRSQARETSEISFHSLRHSAVTMLKASGLSDVFAREIVGHESAAVSRQYTHLTTDDLRAAMQRLPDVTNS